MLMPTKLSVKSSTHHGGAKKLEWLTVRTRNDFGAKLGTCHQVSAQRVSAPDSRISILSHQFRAIGNEIDHQYTLIFRRKLKSTIKRLKETEKDLDNFCQKTFMTILDLKLQAKSMREFYSNPTGRITQAKLKDDICGHLLVIEDAKKYLAAREAVRKLNGYEWTNAKFQMSARTNTNGWIAILRSYEEIAALQKKVEAMLKSAKQNLSDWIGPDGERTTLHRNCAERLASYELRWMKEEIWNLLVCRRIEMDNLHSFMQGLPQIFAANGLQRRRGRNQG